MSKRRASHQWDTYGVIAENLYLNGKTPAEIEAILQSAVPATIIGRWAKRHNWENRRSNGKLTMREVSRRLYAVIVSKIEHLDEDSLPGDVDALVKLYKIFKDQVKETDEQFRYLALDALEDFFTFCVKKLDRSSLQTQRALINDYIAAKIEQL